MYKFNRRLLISTAWAVLIAITFWLGSRYPELDQKAAVAGIVRVPDTLNFANLFEVKVTDPMWLRFLYSTSNWLHTNKRGMIFGVLLGAALLTMFRYLQRKQTRSVFLNTLIGVGTGAPLGVCVNCAAPIAKGLFSAGSSTETTLAAMMSSPTLNVIVLSMLFAIFPLHLAVIKVVATIFCLLIILPILCRYFFKKNSTIPVDINTCSKNSNPSTSLAAELIEVTKEFWKSLIYVFKTTVPLMVLAGFLAVVCIEILNFGSLFSQNINPLSLLGVSAFAIFLPTPIALDIVLAHAFYSSGVPIGYVMTLLFSLGIYSIYAFFIVWTTISRGTAIALYLILTLAGAGVGLGADYYHNWHIKNLLANYPDQQSTTFSYYSGPTLKTLEIHKGISAQVPQNYEFLGKKESIQIFRSQMLKQDEPRSEQFTRLEGHQIGLDRKIDFDIEDFYFHFSEGRGLAAGDINHDGWPDIVVATKHGVKLFQNNYGKFLEQPLSITGNDIHNVMSVALVDLDNDGHLDLFVSPYGAGKNLFYLGLGDSTFQATPIELPNSEDTRVSMASAFGDLDIDGDLDIVLGNWYMGVTTAFPPPSSKNSIIYLNQEKFEKSVLDSVSGETLALLLSDIDQNGFLDLITGNDFGVPDTYYFGQSNGVLKQANYKLIEKSTHDTMSIDSADINNDLSLEIFLAQSSSPFNGFPSPEAGQEWKVQKLGQEYCDNNSRELDRRHCLRNVEARSTLKMLSADSQLLEECEELPELSSQSSCRSMTFLLLAMNFRTEEFCRKIATEHSLTRFLCDSYFSANIGPHPRNKDNDIQQDIMQNILLAWNQETQRFEDRATELGLGNTGWSWNAKFADLNNDEFQDIYIANGSWHLNYFPANALLMNRGGENFERVDQKENLTEYQVTSSYLYVDYDNDGDIDIISNPPNSTMQILRNNESANHSVTIQLRDRRGNHFGVGAKVFIFYAETNKQIREIKASGGHRSFDPLVAHFGLGKTKKIDQIKVIWPDGISSTVEGPLDSDTNYIIERL